MAGNLSDTTTVAQHTIAAPGLRTAAVTADPGTTNFRLHSPGDAAPARGEGE